MATTAAPTYFPSYHGVDHARLIDGGVWANNPAMVGVVEAVSMLGVELKHMSVLSLGTTDPVNERPAHLDNGGLLKWASAGIDVVMRGQSLGISNQVCHMLGEDNFERINPPVPAGMFSLDKVSPEALLSKAGHISRSHAEVFEKKFRGHLAAKYSSSVATSTGSSDVTK